MAFQPIGNHGSWNIAGNWRWRVAQAQANLSRTIAEGMQKSDAQIRRDDDRAAERARVEQGYEGKRLKGIRDQIQQLEATIGNISFLPREVQQQALSSAMAEISRLAGLVDEIAQTNPDVGAEFEGKLTRLETLAKAQQDHLEETSHLF